MLFARYFSVEQYGKYSQVFLILAFLVALLANALPMGMSYFYGQYKSYSQRQLIFKRFFYTFVVISLIVGCLFYLFAPLVSKWFMNEWLLQERLLISILIGFTIFNSYFKNYAILTKKLQYYFYVNVIAFGAMLIMQILLVFNHAKIHMFLVVFVLAQILVFGMWIIKAFYLLKLKTPAIFVTISEFKYILPVTAVGLIGIINELIDQLMVSTMLGPEQMAELKVGSFQIPFISVITVSTTALLIPIFSKMINENKNHEIVKIWREITEKTTVLLVPIFVFSLVFAEQIIGLLFSDKYVSAPLIFQIYALKYFFTVITFGAVMGSIGLQKAWMNNLIVIIILNSVLNYFAISYFGIFGAAIVTAFVWYFGAFLQVIQINKKLDSKFSDYFPWKKYIGVLSVAILTVLPVYVIFFVFKFQYWVVIPFAIVYYLSNVYLFDRKFEYIIRGVL